MKIQKNYRFSESTIAILTELKNHYNIDNETEVVEMAIYLMAKNRFGAEKVDCIVNEAYCN